MLTGINFHLDTFKQKLKELHGDTDFVDAFRKGLNSFIDINIPTASVLTLNTVPYAIIPAPGAGFAVIMKEVFATVTYNSIAYTCNSAGASFLGKSDGSGANHGIVLTQTFIQASASTAIHARGTSTAVVPVANEGVWLKATSTDPASGNSAIKLRAWYKIVALPITSV